VIPVSIIDIEIGIVRKVVRQDQYRQKENCDRHLQHGRQSMRHRVPLSFGVPLLMLTASAGSRSGFALEENFSWSGGFLRPYPPKVVAGNAKKPPGNRVASSLGRIVPTEAKPSELSGEILSLAKYRVKTKTGLL
jgi:hypothetical protein